ncbi:hypothetical protein AB0L40_00115 [Patulibacter sp. NPDC049589]|uniref:hypothetical protein n=1 Tax=Patulibacter sp. NPDC049589 TaxID=3154731 RepID=UPI003418ADB4
MITLRRAASLLAGLATLAVATTVAAPSAHADATWRFAPADAPALPDGASPAPYGVALGPVTDISFWSPNRGVLMTAGNGVVPQGLYTYDGRSWRQLSTVCGGSPEISDSGVQGQGRVAWAGPDEFWTIADQRPGQIVGGGADSRNVSLCHFKDGQVVASYALPVGQPTSYSPMNSATCSGPSDCWFGGLSARGSSLPFHLHWDGSTLSRVGGLHPHRVASMVTIGGRTVESVTLGRNDAVDPAEDPDHPAVLHDLRNDAGGVRITDAPLDDAGCTGVICPPLPNWGTDAASGRPVSPVTMTGLQLSSDGGTIDPASRPASPQLWAVTGPLASGSFVPAGKATGHPLALRYAGGEWRQVEIPPAAIPVDATPSAIAAVPGQPAAWVSYDPDGDDGARVARIAADGTAGAPVRLGPDQDVGGRGNAGPIACPAVDDCWAATDAGWLFHLTDGTTRAQDTDPAFASVISFRPSDGGTPFVPPDAIPVDDSLANQAPPVVPPTLAATPTPTTTTRVLSPLKSTGKARVVKGNTLTIRIVLRGRAKVQLRALRTTKVTVKAKGKTKKRTKTVLRVVAQTKRTTLSTGAHTLRLKLDRKRWPTKIDLRVTRVGKPLTEVVPVDGGGSSSGDSVSTR